MPVLDSDAFTPSLTTKRHEPRPFRGQRQSCPAFFVRGKAACRGRGQTSDSPLRITILRLIIGQSDFDVAIKTTRTAECWVDNRGIVHAPNDHDTVPTDTAIEFLQKPIDHAAHVVRIMAFVTTGPCR